VLMIEYRTIDWWFWLITACFLSLGLAGEDAGFYLAIGVTVFQVIYFIVREKSLSSFPVQVRYWYLIFLLVVLPEPLQFLYWLPAIGTWAQLVTGYCTMARCVSLLPWNRREKLSLSLLGKIFLTPPVRGSILQGMPSVDNRQRQ